MKTVNSISFIAIAVLLIINSGCKRNTAPIPNAGNDQDVFLPVDFCTLNGLAQDRENNIQTILWSKISGPSSFVIEHPGSLSTKVSNLEIGVYQFELTVTDDEGLYGNDIITVTVGGGPTNTAPISNAGDDQTITLPTNTITLNGNSSTDPDNNITSYAWSKISGPSSFNIGNANSVQTQVANLIEGVYQFELNVTDAGGLFSKDTMQVTVNQDPNNPLVDIYVAGDQNDVPVYWKNGQAIPLDNGPSGYGYSGTSITVVGSDVCVAGTRIGFMWNEYAAKYWKNGQGIQLGNYAGATSIAQSGSDVYVAGYEWENTGLVAKYWKNGQPVALTNGSSDAWANSIVVEGSDIYVAGYEAGNARYWKNGQAVSLTNGTNGGEATAITVQGNDIYVAGYEGKVAKYWKNGQAISLTNGTNYASARSIAVAGNNVYVAGWEGDFYGMVGGTGSVAKYWKNGQEVSLTSGTTYAYANSIAIFGIDVYVAGTEISGSNHVAKYWKNGQAVPLSNGGSATSIVVVQH